MSRTIINDYTRNALLTAYMEADRKALEYHKDGVPVAAEFTFLLSEVAEILTPKTCGECGQPLRYRRRTRRKRKAVTP